MASTVENYAYVRFPQFCQWNPLRPLFLDTTRGFTVLQVSAVLTTTATAAQNNLPE